MSDALGTLISRNLGGLALYEASACHVFSVDPRTRRIVEATGGAPRVFGYDSLDGVLVADLVPLSVKDHDSLFDSFVQAAKDGRFDSSHQMGGRVLAAKRQDGSEFRAVIVLKWTRIRDADRIVATVIVHG